MRIIENPELSEKIAAKLRDFRTFRNGGEIHRSDLIYCPRKAYFRIKGVEEKETDEGPVTKRRIGESLHVLFEVCQRKEVSVEKDGVVGSIDMLADPDLGYVDDPIELKSTRAKLREPDWIEFAHPQWVDQLMMACLFTGKLHGHLIVLQLITGDLKTYTFSFTPEDLTKFWGRKLELLTMLRVALDTSDFSILPFGSWECKNCGFTEPCLGVVKVASGR